MTTATDPIAFTPLAELVKASGGALLGPKEIASLHTEGCGTLRDLVKLLPQLEEGHSKRVVLARSRIAPIMVELAEAYPTFMEQREEAERLRQLAEQPLRMLLGADETPLLTKGERVGLSERRIASTLGELADAIADKPHTLGILKERVALIAKAMNTQFPEVMKGRSAGRGLY